MNDVNRQSVCVIGAGMVGVCCALSLLERGFRVTLVDRDEPGAGTSSGNACTIATYASVPINDPAVLRRLPGLLSGRDPLLVIDPVYAARNLAWFVRFLKYCRSREVARTRAGLAALLRHAHTGLDPLVTLADAESLVATNGMIYAYAAERDFEQDRPYLAQRRENGARFTEIDAATLQELEPGIRLPFHRGVLFEGVSSVHDPRRLIETFHQRFVAGGGQWRQVPVRATEAGANGVTVRLDNGDTLATDFAVIAAGAFSRRIAGSGAENLPLDTERGYHIQFSGEQSRVNRPVHWVGAGFYAVPTLGGLRLAGLVEFAGLDKGKNTAMLAHLQRRARRMFDLDGKEADQTWLGYRPTLPDSLPVIGPSPESPRIVHAFGHHHLGLTLGGITGRLVSDLLANEAPLIDLSPYRADRFG